mgnify:CR=1 FL=1
MGLFNFMQSKELAGQERATGSALFASGHADDAGQQRLAYLIESQERALEVFAQFAPAEAVQLWQRSDDGPMRRAAREASLLLVELPMEVMSEQLPLLKANWIAGGETATLLSSLQDLTNRAWRIMIAKYEPVRFIAWP